MTHCYNCGHAGTFVLLAQFALAVPGPDPSVRDAPAGVGRSSRADQHHSGRVDGARYGSRRRTDARRDDTARGNDSRGGSSTDPTPRFEPAGLPTQGDLSFTVQCPACDSTDVGVTPADLLARHGATTR